MDSAIKKTPFLIERIGMHDNHRNPLKWNINMARL